MLLLLTLFLSGNLFAYNFNYTSRGDRIRWDNPKKEIGIKINYSRFNNSSETLSDADIKAVIEESILQFQNLTDYDLYITTSSKADATISFTDKAQYFSGSALAITSLAYSDDTGKISDAAIIINDSGSAPFNLVATKFVTNSFETYLGNVITHELGHLVGLDHSEIVGSSMFYSIFKGQSILSNDDKAGFKDLYKVSNNAKVFGYVVGKGYVPAFGAHVRLYSLEDNEVVQGAVTNSEGYFYFKNLEAGNYFITVDKLYNPDSISKTTEKTNYQNCNKKDYVLSPFFKCGNYNKGYPQKIEVTSNSQLDLGYLTLSCDSKLDSGYLLSKINQEYYELDHKNGEIFWGYIDDDDIGVKQDLLLLDLREVEITGVNNILNLDLNISSLFNKFEAEIQVKREDQANFTVYQAATDGTFNKLKTDISVQFPLSNQEENNLIYIKVIPLSLSFAEQKDIVGTPTIFSGALPHYLLKYSHANTTEITFLEDNSRCLEGNIVVANIQSISEEEDEDSSSPLSCGTIKNGSNSDFGGGMISFIIGLMFICCLNSLKQMKLLS